MNMHTAPEQDRLAILFGEIRLDLMMRSQRKETGDPPPHIVSLMTQAVKIVQQRGGDPYSYLLNIMKLAASTGEITLTSEQQDRLLLETCLPALADAA